MNFKNGLKDFVITFVVIFVVTLVIAAGATYGYELIAHGDGIINWVTSFYLAITMGVLYAMVNIYSRRIKAQNR
ncbi:MAG TPA: hypothetical protein PLF13_00640 [candidate division Zixibacteria bacterium]|nr:hypothetical protein [candidate division Zixibacteria bacterium]